MSILEKITWDNELHVLKMLLGASVLVFGWFGFVEKGEEGESI